MSGAEFNLFVALKQIKALVAELVKAEQFIKNALKDNIAEAVTPLLDTLIALSIPKLVTEIDNALKTSCFQKEEIDILKISDAGQNDNEMEIDIKEEDIVREIVDDEEEVAQDFPIFPEHVQGADDEQIAIVVKTERNEGHLTSDSEEFETDAEGSPYPSDSSEEEYSPQQKIREGKRVRRRLQLPKRQVAGVRSSFKKLRIFMKSYQKEDGSYQCPHCLKRGQAKQFSTLWSAIRHLKTIHNEGKVRKSVPRLKIKGGQAEVSPTQGQDLYEICGTSNLKKAKVLSNFVKKCLALPGVKVGLLKFRNASNNNAYDCPNCPAGKLIIKDCWTFMRHLILIHPNSDLIPLPFVNRTTKPVPVANPNLTYKCHKCPKSYNAQSSLRWHLKHVHKEQNSSNRAEQVAQESSDEELNPNEQIQAPSSAISTTLNSSAPYVISGRTYDERKQSMLTFSSLCLKVPGTKALLKKHQTKDGTFICPLCIPQKILMSPKVSNFLAHILATHEYPPTLVPLPYIKARGESNGRMPEPRKPKLSTESEESCEDAVAQFPRAFSNSCNVFVISGDNWEQRHQSINVFASLCVNAPGAREGLKRYRQANGNLFTCPHCPPGKKFLLTRPWNFMRHLIVAHSSSNLIPLPFTRSKAVPKKITSSSSRSKKRKRETLSEDSDDEKSDHEDTVHDDIDTELNPEEGTEDAIFNSFSMEDAINELAL